MRVSGEPPHLEPMADELTKAYVSIARETVSKWPPGVWATPEQRERTCAVALLRAAAELMGCDDRTIVQWCRKLGQA